MWKAMAISKMSLCTFTERFAGLQRDRKLFLQPVPVACQELGGVRAAVPRGWVMLRQPRTPAPAIGVLTQDPGEEQAGEAT